MQTDSPQQAPHALPKRFGRYNIVRPLSKGGMAYVFEARRESLEGVAPRVALKVILPEHRDSETFKQLFINEARLGASMHHQNLVQIQDFDCQDETYYLVMEYVEGLTLRKVIALCERAKVPIPMGVIAEIGRQACDGLHFAHTATDDSGTPLKLVHRDIKPSNLILSPHGVVKVLDFGISKGVLREEREGSVKGTWGYMAPEQASGLDIGPQADVFGLATVLYELAALEPMFEDQSKEEIRHLLQDDHAARVAAMLEAEDYGALIGVLVRGLQRDPAARFETAQDFGRALSALLPDPITARDSVVAFVRQVEGLDPDKPVPEIAADAPPVVVPPVGDSQEGSLVHQAGMGANPHVGGFVTFLAGIVLSLVILTAVTAVLVALLGRAMTDFQGDGTANSIVPIAQGTPPGPARPLAVDEPAGPAGAGAPGEDRPPPVASRRAVHRVPPPPKPQGTSEPQPADVATTQTTPPPAPVVPAPAPTDAATGTVVIDAKQDAEVYIAGKFIDTVPVRKDLPVGSYEVVLVAADGRRRMFSVDVIAEQRTKKVWDFDRMEWR